jgi:arginine-tRNA-protein transferase
VDLEVYGLEMLLKQGYRHFGRFLFRPVCEDCSLCVPVRIDLANFSLSRWDRRTMKRLSSAGLIFSLEEPSPDPELYHLYLNHKSRFAFPPAPEDEDRESFNESFFTPTPGARVLKLMDGERTVAVSHLDMTVDTCSAVYCYWDANYSRFSPGKASILMEAKIAAERNLKYLCLGYLVEDNEYMSYKKNYLPLQVSGEPGVWKDWLDPEGVPEPGMPEHPRFTVPAGRIIASPEYSL